MSMISQLRKQVTEKGIAILNIDDFNQLQAEWVKRISFDGASEVFQSQEIERLKAELQNAVNERNEAWFELEGLNETI